MGCVVRGAISVGPGWISVARPIGVRLSGGSALREEEMLSREKRRTAATRMVCWGQ